MRPNGFFKRLYVRVLSWFIATDLYASVVLRILPYIRFTTYYSKLKGSDYLKLYEHLRPGDVILSYDKKKLSTLLIPGRFSHAALCVDKGVPWEVSEMTHKGYVKSTFFDICKESDFVAILRHIDIDDDGIANVVSKCKSFYPSKYDVSFSLGVKFLYCSELVYQSFPANSLGANLDDFAGLGRPYISPSGLRQAKNLILVANSHDVKET